MFPRFNIPRCFLVRMPRCFQVSIEFDQYDQGHLSSGCDEGHDNFYSETIYFDCMDPCLAQATSDGLKRYQNRNPIGGKDGSHVFFVYICRCIGYSAVLLYMYMYLLLSLIIVINPYDPYSTFIHIIKQVA